MTTYNDDNIFAKILEGKIPCNKIYEDKGVLCFQDINPVSKIHVLIIPKSKYVYFHDFVSKANEETITSFFNSIKIIVEKLDLVNSGYRLITNHGMNANQEVPHFHVHILGGNSLGPLIVR